MLARWQFWVTTVVALLVALTAGYSMMLFSQNRNTQGQLAQRAQYVQQSVQLNGIYREMVEALGNLAIRSQDKAVVDLLASQGITLNAGNAPPAAPADAKKGAK